MSPVVTLRETENTLHDGKAYHVYVGDEYVGAVNQTRVTVAHKTNPTDRIVNRYTYPTKWVLSGTHRLHFEARYEAVALVLGHHFGTPSHEQYTLAKTAKTI